MFLDGGRPNDQRGFLHKSFIGKAVGGLIKRALPVVGLAAEAFGTARTLLGRTRPTRPRSETARPTLEGQQGKELGRQLKFQVDPGPAQTFATATTTVRPRTDTRPPRLAVAGNGVDDCPSGTIPDPRGSDFCVSPRSTFGRGRGATRVGVGDAVMGQFGAALEPGVQIIERSVCLAGMQLAKDGLCYNKGAITNSQRMWPRGRRPLLTGGDMRAISIASRAGAKLERTTKRLRALGMMKRLPPGRKPAPHAHAKPVAAVSV